MESAQPIRSAAVAALTAARAAAAAALALALACTPRAASSAGIDAAAREAIAHVVEGEIAAGRIPGAVIVAGDAQGVRHREAFGYRSLVPRPEPMTIDTEFDLASLTKVVATTTAIMQLVESRAIKLDAPVARYWPAFADNGKADVTIRELLTHTSGLRPDLPLGPRAHARKGVLAEVVAQRLMTAPGSRVIYSDINFIVLGEVVRRVTHRPFDAYCRRHIFAPLGMRDTMFMPDEKHAARAAPTTADTDGMRVGRVHDPTAARMGGVAGDAGVFSTGDDLARFARMMLNEGALEQHRILRPETIASMAALASPPGEAPPRGLGWALDAPLVSNRYRLPPFGAIYHTGYTGTAIWIDLASKQFIVVLTNRVHPFDQGDARPLREQATSWLSSKHAALSIDDLSRLLPTAAPAVADALRLPSSAGPVRTGIDMLEAEGFAPLAGMRIGLVTNRTGYDSAGQRTIDVLAHAPGVALAAVFAPEHGLSADRDERVSDTRDPLTGVTVHSLYGATRRFDDAVLQGLDALVFDLQDAGVRFFTYETTLGYALEAAAAKHIPLFVLDRPDPIGADRIGGPVLDPGSESFTGYFPLPLIHGMTVGELAQLFNGERAIGADLRVIRMNGYRRSMRFADTGLGWVPISPNLRTIEQADLYPEIGLIEGANVSVGRGTAHPFERIGAPWIDGVALADQLNASKLGVRFEFTPVDFVPTESTYRGIQCHGVAIVRGAQDVGDSPESPDTSFAPGTLGMALLVTLHALYPEDFDLAGTRDSIGSFEAWRAIREGAGIAALQRIVTRSLSSFQSSRTRYLLY